MIKLARVDQHLMAGIGNVYSDEILFHAGVYPRTKVSALGGKQIREISNRMKVVLMQAIDHLSASKPSPNPGFCSIAALEKPVRNTGER